MESNEVPAIPANRLWIATAAVIIVTGSVWKFIDWRTQPPPPPSHAPNNLAAPK